jgi:hypothetical protein
MVIEHWLPERQESDLWTCALQHFPLYLFGLAIGQERPADATRIN